MCCAREAHPSYKFSSDVYHEMDCRTAWLGSTWCAGHCTKGTLAGVFLSKPDLTLNSYENRTFWAWNSGFFTGFFTQESGTFFDPGGENHDFFCPQDTFRTHLSLNMPLSPKILRTPRPISFVFGAPGGVDIDGSLTGR